MAGGGEVDEWITVLQKITSSLAHADRTFTHFCLQCGAHADGSCVLIGGDADCLFRLSAKLADSCGRPTAGLRNINFKASSARRLVPLQPLSQYW
ncbi:MAG: hypothetical protein V1790_07790 [Planctomycetota bacterium]